MPKAERWTSPVEEFWSPKALFRMRFQTLLKQYLNAGGSVARGFGVVWDNTLQHVPISDELQASAYQELLAWAKSEELFTSRAIKPSHLSAGYPARETRQRQI